MQLINLQKTFWLHWLDTVHFWANNNVDQLRNRKERTLRHHSSNYKMSV